jgi:general stress protein YciG
MSDRERRGFASMDEQRRREIASEGGKASHQRGSAHEFSAEEARMAGRKGGQIAHQRGKAHTFSSEEARMAGRKGGVEVSRDREHMSAIGRKGGERARGAQEPATDRDQQDDFHQQRSAHAGHSRAEARS